MLAIGVPIGRLCRRMEERADRVACEHMHDAAAYASALERLHEHNLVPAVLGKGRKTHPDLYDRMTAAGVTPSYPRPDPPSRRPVYAAVFATLLLLGGAAFGLSTIERRAPAVSIALFGASPTRVTQLAIEDGVEDCE